MVAFRLNISVEGIFRNGLTKVEKFIIRMNMRMIFCASSGNTPIFARLALRCLGHHAHDAFHDVVHIGEVAAAVAVVINLYLLALDELFSVKPKYAMSGRPVGPYTVKNRNPVMGMW